MPAKQAVEQYPEGIFCWIDLATGDAQAAKAFYAELFDWELEDAPAPGGMVYTMCRQDGEDVCALFEMGPQMREQGIPPHWASYIHVPDADAAAARATELGATVLVPPFDILDVGRMATLQDPTGAAVNLWQPRRHIGATLVNCPGAWCWNELSTRDTDAAARFYGDLLGWTSEVSEGATGPYTTFRHDGRLVGGMLAITSAWGPDWEKIPPSWGVYFAVEDCAASRERATRLGAKVMMPDTEIPEIGTLCVLADPQGAAFTVIALEIADPPPGY